MAYVRHKVIKGHVYFYLVEGHREGKRVRQKVLKYLGKHGTLGGSNGVVYRGFTKPVGDEKKQETETRKITAIKAVYKSFGYTVRHNLSGRTGVRGKVIVTRNIVTGEVLSRSVSLTKQPALSTMCHELGHVIDNHLEDQGRTFWESQTFRENRIKIQAEFESVGTYKYRDFLERNPNAINGRFFQGYVFTEAEGFANAFEMFLTDYKRALHVVPNMVAEFHKIIRENDDIRQRLEKLDVWTAEEPKQTENVVPNSPLPA